MPYYEFECPKGHVTTEIVPMGTKTWPCSACVAEMRALHERHPNNISAWNPLAKRILSPTRTTFVFADTGKRIRHIKKVATRD